MTFNLPYRLVPEKPVLYSVRHGESIANVNRNIYGRVSDPAAWLTPRGQQQTRATADFLGNHFAEMPACVRPAKIRILRSLMRRAVQTATNIETGLRAALPDVDISVKEDSRLRELEFGYGGNLDEPVEAHNKLVDQLRYQGYRFLSTRLGGESPAHMEPRVRSILDAIFRDFTENRITHFIVVSHGITSRVLNYVRYNKPNSWYEAEPNPDNCAVRLMAETDCGYIFPNDKGQWNPHWEPEEADAGDARLNKNGKFFSPEQMDRLIELQETHPTILEDVLGILDNPDALHAGDFDTALRAAMGSYT